MCSRYIQKSTDLMENPKIKKPRNNQMKYPAPYSQSWTGPSASNTKKTSYNRIPAQKLPSGPKLAARAAKRDARPQVWPDPTVPHLKYGVFRKKNNRVQSGSISPTRANTSEIKKAQSAKEAGTAPLFVVRALDSRLIRCLSRAASTHLDIKPRNFK